MDVARKLDVGTQQRLGTCLGIIGNLLELVDGDIDIATALGEQFKNLLMERSKHSRRKEEADITFSTDGTY